MMKRIPEILNLKKIPFAKNARGVSKICREVLLLRKSLQTKAEVKNMISKYYDLYYTVNKYRDEKEIVNKKNENNEIDSNIYEDFITPNDYIGSKKNNEILK